MTIPNGVENSELGCYWRLKKALYGLKQAGRQQKKYLHEVLIKFGFIHAFADDCLYIKYHKGKITLLILVYVDDIAIIEPDRCYIISFKSFLGKNFEITNLGKLKHILGVLVTRDHLRHLIYLNQSAYIQHTIACFELENSTLVSIFLAIKHNLILS